MCVNLEGVNGKNKGECYQNTKYVYVKLSKKYIKEEKFKIKTLVLTLCGFKAIFFWMSSV